MRESEDGALKPVSSTPNSELRTTRLLALGVGLIVAVMPFHAFLVVYLGHLFGHQALFQVWKEVLALVLSFAGIWAISANPELRHRLINWPNAWAAGFILVALVISSLHWPGLTALAFGIKTDLVFLILFILAQLAGSVRLADRLTKTILITMTAICVFGLLQILVLPPDFLGHFGYGPLSIMPFERVDPAVKGIRILATLGGPNQLGSFLILPLCLLMSLILRQRKWWLIPLLAAGGFVLLHTYSRSAWLGALAGLIVTAALCLPRKWAVIFGISCLVVLSATGIFASQAISQGGKLQYYLLHGRIFENRISGSDQGRPEAFKQGINQIKSQPEGRGLGTAGPASKYGKTSVITENYYLQIGIETGIFGLALFIALMLSLGIKLFQLNQFSLLAAPLLGALVGISIVNLFLHGWADSSTALVYWSTAGAVIGSRHKDVKAN